MARLSRIPLMMKIAREAHTGQKYGRRFDYFEYHILGVLSELMLMKEFQQADPKTAEDMILVVLGHDLFEDTDVDAPFLQAKGIPAYVCHSIALVSKEDGLKYKPYIDRILEDYLAWVGKKADTRFNLKQSIRDNNEVFIQRYTKQLTLLSDRFSGDPAHRGPLHG